MNKPIERLAWHKQPAGAGETIVLQGTFDEDSPRVLDRVREAAGASKRLSLDLGGIKRINSIGIRGWMQFIGSLAGHEVLCLRCPPVMVEQLNSVRGFRGHATIGSVLAPYLCERCNQVSYEELVVGRDVPRGGVVEEAPSRRCPTCGSEMVFDDLPDRYFQFISFL
jgi:hypothetical protein